MIAGLGESVCAYCGGVYPTGDPPVCREQGGDPPGTWRCSRGALSDCARCGHSAAYHGRARPICDVRGCRCIGYQRKGGE